MKQVAGVRDVLSLAEVSALLEQLQKVKKLGSLFSFGKALQRTRPSDSRFR